MSEIFFVGGNGISEGEKSFPPLLKWCFGPRLESLPCTRHRIVDIFLGGYWNLGVWLLGGRVDVVAGFGGGGRFVVDDIVKGL